MYKLKFFTVMVLAASMFVASCNSESDELAILQEQIPETFGDSELDGVAFMLLSIGIDQQICDEVFETVSRSIKVGLDEELRFRELWEDDKSVKVRNSPTQKSSLKNRIENFHQQMATRSSNGNDEVFNLKNSNIQIYWPYSDDWDGKAMPVITCMPDTQRDWNYGYKKIDTENGVAKIDTVIVNEEYAMKNPVWIINRSEIPYEELPNFNKGEFRKGDIYYGTAKEPKIGTRSGSITPWMLKKMKVTQQHDDFFNGGSEFDIQVGYPVLTGYAAGVSKIRQTFTRKEIKKGVWRTINDYLNTNWRPEQITNYLLITETDHGENKGLEFEVSYSSGKNGGTVKATGKMSLKTHDDLIYQRTWDRDNVLYVNKDKINESRGVHWIMPIETISH